MEDPSCALIFDFYARIWWEHFHIGSQYRYKGLPIRPVYDDRPDIKLSRIYFGRDDIQMIEGERIVPEIFFSPDAARNKDLFWTSSDPEVVSVSSSSGELLALKLGSSTITAKSYDGGKTASIDVYVNPLPVPDQVDLGLSVNWASFNVGARKTEDIGFLYEWGETFPEYRSYSGKDEDVASVKFGGKWRMPTLSEIDDLREKCTWEWTTLNGVQGYRVTSRLNDSSIFLPAEENNFYDYGGFYGGYWTQTKHIKYSGDIYTLVFTRNSLYYYEDDHDGSDNVTHYIRAVYGDPADYPVSSVSLSTDRMVVAVDTGPKTITASVSPNNAAIKRVTWSSSDNGIISIATASKTQTTAEITGLSPGSTTLTVTTIDGEKTAECVVQVILFPEEAWFNLEESSLVAGESLILTPSYLPGNATETSHYWVSDDSSIAAVSNGKVTGLKSGKTKIRAVYQSKDGGTVEAVCSITVLDPNGSHEGLGNENWD